VCGAPRRREFFDAAQTMESVMESSLITELRSLTAIALTQLQLPSVATGMRRTEQLRI
jgi:hypothetical protein